MALDKETYQPERRRSCASQSKQGGKALIAILGNGLVTSKEVDIAKAAVKSNSGRQRLGSWAYATALLYRPMDEQAKRMPSRAIRHQVDRRRSVGTDAEVSLPAKRKSSQAMGLTSREGRGAVRRRRGRITVAAVDVAFSI